MLGWPVEDRGIAPHIPVFDKSKRTDGIFERADVTYGHKADACICPGGKELTPFRRSCKTPRTGVDKDGTMRYRASNSDCDLRPLKARGCPKDPHRKILRSIYEGARDIAKTEDYEISRKLRKKAEMPLADLKRILGLGRLRLRGPCGAEPQKAGKADPKGRKAKPGVRERTAVPTGTHSKTQATEELFNKIGQVLPIGFQTGTRPEYGLS